MYKYDLSMPVKDMYSLVEEARERFEEKGLFKDGSIKMATGYGHVGDGEPLLSLFAARPSHFHVADCAFKTGNLHINIVATKWDPKVEQAIEPWIYGATGTSSSSSSIFFFFLSADVTPLFFSRSPRLHLS